jgi:superfamily II DNA or RNA helicase
MNYYPIGDDLVYGVKKLEPFQKKGPKRALKYRFCILKAPVRGGKTLMFAKAIRMIGHEPVLVVTRSEKDVVIQIQRELKKYLRKKIGILLEGKFVREDIVVTHYGALESVFRPARKKTPVKRKETRLRNEKIIDFVKYTKVLVLDECHHALAPSFREVLTNFKSLGYKIGVSGTPKPADASVLEMESAIGPVVLDVPFKTLIKAGRVAQPVVILYDLPKSWYSNILFDANDVYESNIVRNTLRNRFIAEIVQNLKKTGLTSLVPVSKLAHGDLLKEEIPNSFFMYGKVKTEQRTELYNRLQDKKLYCIVSTVGKEALDLPKLNAMINAEGFDSPVATIQRMRSLTASEGKNFGLVIDFIDKGDYLESSSNERKKKYEGIDGFIVKVKKVPENYYAEKSRWL